jgi:hypothetical protein
MQQDESSDVGYVPEIAAKSIREPYATTLGSHIQATDVNKNIGSARRRVSTSLRQVLMEFSECFVLVSISGFFPENFAPGNCRSDDRQLA